MFTFFRAIARFTIGLLSALVLTIDVSPAAVAAPTAGHKKVYLLRGLTNILSPGIDQLSDELQKRGIDATIANHTFSDSLASDAIDGCKSGRINSVILVGHSLGARAAVAMAELLQAGGVHVALIITIDPIVKAVVPNNVRLVKNFYLSSGVGTMVEHGGHFHGTLRNVDMAKTDYGHVSLTTAPAIQNQVMKDILSARSSCR